MILSDKEITELADNQHMVFPFTPCQVRKVDGEKVVSYGVSSYGYDIRCGRTFDVFQRVERVTVWGKIKAFFKRLFGISSEEYVIDPLNFKAEHIRRVVGDFVDIPANGFVLTSSYEYINMPEDVTGLVLGKSTYARCGIDNLATPLEAGWCGNITLEFSNNTKCPVRMYAMQGVAQVLFFRGNPCLVSYANRGGKYQGQTGITYPKG